jgi:hypothetical protein
VDYSSVVLIPNTLYMKVEFSRLTLFQNSTAFLLGFLMILLPEFICTQYHFSKFEGVLYFVPDKFKQEKA